MAFSFLFLFFLLLLFIFSFCIVSKYNSTDFFLKYLKKKYCKRFDTITWFFSLLLVTSFDHVENIFKKAFWDVINGSTQSLNFFSPLGHCGLTVNMFQCSILEGNGTFRYFLVLLCRCIFSTFFFGKNKIPEGFSVLSLWFWTDYLMDSFLFSNYFSFVARKQSDASQKKKKFKVKHFLIIFLFVKRGVQFFLLIFSKMFNWRTIGVQFFSLKKKVGAG